MTPTGSIATLADTIRRGETTAVATVEAAIERIEQQDSELGCFHETYHDLALEAGIDYLGICPCEVAVRGELLRKLWEAPGLFREVYSKDGATIFQVTRS